MGSYNKLCKSSKVVDCTNFAHPDTTHKQGIKVSAEEFLAQNPGTSFTPESLVDYLKQYMDDDSIADRMPRHDANVLHMAASLAQTRARDDYNRLIDASRVLGRIGGSQTSEKKKVSSRLNAKKPRPRNKNKEVK